MKYLAECWQQLLESVVHSDWRLLDCGLDPHALQQAAVGGHGQEGAVVEPESKVDGLGHHTYRLAAGK